MFVSYTTLPHLIYSSLTLVEVCLNPPLLIDFSGGSFNYLIVIILHYFIVFTPPFTELTAHIFWLSSAYPKAAIPPLMYFDQVIGTFFFSKIDYIYLWGAILHFLLVNRDLVNVFLLSLYINLALRVQLNAPPCWHESPVDFLLYFLSSLFTWHGNLEKRRKFGFMYPIQLLWNHMFVIFFCSLNNQRSTEFVLISCK